MDVMDVSIIIVAWNVREFLYNCIKSVYEQTRGIDFEVIYVDNASEDGSVEMVRKEFPEVRIIENEENKGFIIANNKGIEIAEGRYVLLLNSDTIVLDNAIAKTVEFSDKHPKAAVVGCKVLYPDGTLQRNCFMYPSVLNLFLLATYLNKIFPRSKFFGREYMEWWDYSNAREVEAVAGCYSLVRREAIDQVGVMDERYFVYGDDPDWCFRFKKTGWKIMYTPESRIIHCHGKTTKHMKREFRLQLSGSLLMFMFLHGGKTAFMFSRLIMALFFLLRIPYWLLIWLIKKEKRKESLHTTGTYCLGHWYCLTNWKKLLMNEEVIKL
jgi:GT2 family glycosyltransferase